MLRDRVHNAEQEANGTVESATSKEGAVAAVVHQRKAAS
jgi:hypothetical protein